MKEKPVKEARYAYSYNDLIDYIEDKYKIETRGYKRDHDKEYRDFWHWMIDNCWYELHNGTYQYLPVRELTTGEGYFSEDVPWWVKEIAQLIYDEYHEDEMEVFVEW